MTSKTTTLETYARRRFVLSGASMPKEHFPYITPMEHLGVERPGRDGQRSSFAHYDYLGLGGDPRVLAAVHRAVDEIGIGSGASRLVGGELAIHRELEAELARFLGVEDTLSLVSGYGTNVTLISHLLTKDDLILVDESSHNSIMAGTQLARAETSLFRHNDLDHLASLLEQRRPDYKRVLVIVEGLYSMDGDIPDLPQLIELCRSHGAWLMVDEAHSIGVLGRTGRGITEHFGLASDDVDLIVGTWSKAFASCGGFIAGKQGVIDWLRCSMPGFVYSVGMPPPNAAAARCALQILQSEPQRLIELNDKSKYFLNGARRRGLNVGKAMGMAVIPIMFADTPTAIHAANVALDAGYFVPPIVLIAVPKELPRMRFFVTCNHTYTQIDDVLDALERFCLMEPEIGQSGEKLESKKTETKSLEGALKSMSV